MLLLWKEGMATWFKKKKNSWPCICQACDICVEPQVMNKSLKDEQVGIGGRVVGIWGKGAEIHREV